jgi:peptide/nickel transport system substrate-binding protein
MARTGAVRALFALIPLVVAFPALAAGPAPSPTPGVYGDAVVDVTLGDASNLIPILASDSASHGAAEMIYNGLVKYDKDYTIVGDLAESWEILDGGLGISFKLRPGVTFHDGKPMTSADVLYSYKAIIDPNTKTAYEGDYRLVTKATAPDPRTFVVRYDKPFAPALISWSMSVLPKHLLEGTDINTSPLGRKPVGTGPFRFKDWKSGERIVLSANPTYFEGRPNLDAYVLRVIPDLETQFLELKAGGVDWMGLTPMQWTRQTETEFFKKKFNKYKYLSNGYTYLGYNLQDPRFADKRVRQAFTHAINRGDIIKGVMQGLAEEAQGPYKPGSWVYNPKVRKYPFDPSKAKALLAEAGWKDTNGDGLVDKGGKPFTFTIITNQNEIRQKCGEIILKNLEAIGVKADLRVLEWATFLKEFVEPGKFEALILGWNILQDPDLFDVWHSSKTAPGDLNHTNFVNAEVDALLEKGRHTFDQAVRKQNYDRFQEILAEEQPYTFLYVPYALQIIDARFKGIEPAPAGIAHNFIRWWVPREAQRYKSIP